MTIQDFHNATPEDKINLVNNLLRKEKVDHLKNVAAKLDLTTSQFSKIMRHSGEYQYNQTTKQYDKLLTIDEYRKIAKVSENGRQNQNQVLSFLTEHFDEIKVLLQTQKEQLSLDPQVYSPDSETIVKSIQLNADIYNQFSELHSQKYPHYRLRDVFSQCLVDFINKYDEPS